jgi:hypothetical protein
LAAATHARVILCSVTGGIAAVFYSAPNQASPQGCTIYRRRVLKERFNFPTADSRMRQGPELLRTRPMPFGAGAKPFCRLDKSTGSLLKDRTGIVRKS